MADSPILTLCPRTLAIPYLTLQAAMRTIRRLTQGKTTEELMAMRGSVGGGARPPVTIADLEGAIENTKPSVARSALVNYERWAEEHGAL